MDTPYEHLPFEVRFVQNQGNKTKSITIDSFYSNERDAAEEKSIKEILENIPLTITFRAPAGSRLYMNGLDALPAHNVVEIDDMEGEVYLPPCEDFAILKKDYYPLIPSRNQIKVRVEGKDYFAFISVGPSQLTEIEYKTMIKDLENLVKGLSLNLIQKNLGLGYYTIKPIPPVRLYQFMVIQKHFRTIMASLSDLRTKVNYKVKKNYSMEPVEKARRSDLVTISHKLTHPENLLSLKVPNHAIDYDLAENRWVKHIIRRLTVNLSEFQLAVDEYVNSIQRYIKSKSFYAQWQESTRLEIVQKELVLETLSDYREVAGKIINGLGIIKESDWYDHVSPLSQTSMPHVLMYDPRYFALYKMYHELQQENFEVSVDPSYSYQYKRTDNLYEVWGFLKVCEILQKGPLNFRSLSGWIYDKDFDTSSSLIPTLNPGTSITLTKDDMLLKLVYDEEIPTKPTKADFEHPLYIHSKNRRPDGRIDVYKGDIYIGSVLFDMKYRDSSSLNYENSKSAIESSYIGRQITGYGNAGRSLFTYGRTTKSFLTNFNIVSEVLILYPKGDDTVTYPEVPNAKFIKLIPGTDPTGLPEHLQDLLQTMLVTYEENRRD